MPPLPLPVSLVEPSYGHVSHRGPCLCGIPTREQRGHGSNEVTRATRSREQRGRQGSLPLLVESRVVNHSQRSTEILIYRVGRIPR